MTSRGNDRCLPYNDHDRPKYHDTYHDKKNSTCAATRRKALPGTTHRTQNLAEVKNRDATPFEVPTPTTVKYNMYSAAQPLCWPILPTTHEGNRLVSSRPRATSTSLAPHIPVPSLVRFYRPSKNTRRIPIIPKKKKNRFQAWIVKRSKQKPSKNLKTHHICMYKYHVRSCRLTTLQKSTLKLKCSD